MKFRNGLRFSSLNLLFVVILAGCGVERSNDQPEAGKPQSDRGQPNAQGLQTKSTPQGKQATSAKAVDFNDRNKIALLLDQLKVKDDGKAFQAQRELARYQGAAVAPILELLKKGIDDKSYRFVRTIGMIGPEARSAIPFLLSLIKKVSVDDLNRLRVLRRADRSAEVWALYALGNIGAPDRGLPVSDLIPVARLLVWRLKDGWDPDGAINLSFWISQSLHDAGREAQAATETLAELSQFIEDRIGDLESTARKSRKTVVRIFEKGKLLEKESKAQTENAQNTDREKSQLERFKELKALVDKTLSQIANP